MGKRIPIKIVEISAGSPSKNEAARSVVQPPQNVQLTVSKNDNSREDQRNMPYGFHGKPFEHYVDPDAHEKDVKEQTERDSRDKTRLRVEKAALVIGIVGIIGLYYTFDETRRQANVADKTFQATQSAAVYLGLPDGKLADFLLTEKGLYIRLFFQNTGRTTAEHTVITAQTVTVIPDGGPVETTFLPPDKHVPGPDIPPGSPYTEHLFYPGATKEELESRKKYLQIVGRITYSDVFGDHCEAFNLEYSSPPIEGFKFATEGSPDHSKICGMKEYTITSDVIVLQPGVPRQLFPFPVAPAHEFPHDAPEPQR